MYLLLLAIIYMAFISLGLPDSLLGAVWPVVHQELAVPLGMAGTIGMVICGFTSLSSLLSGRLIKRFGVGRVTAASVLLTALALFGFSRANSVWFLCLMAVPLGFGAGGVDTGLNNFVALHYKASHMSFLHCFWGIGATAGPFILSLFLAKSGGWRTGYMLISIIQFCLVALLIVALPVWKKVACKERAAGSEIEQLGTHEAFARPGVKYAMLMFVFYCGAEYSAGMWSSSFFVACRGVSPELAARWTSCYYASITVGRLLAGFITMKLPQKKLVALGLGLASAGAVLMALPLHPYFALAGVIMIGLGFAPYFPGMIQLTPENFGRNYSQSSIGLEMAAAAGGAVFWPPLVGAAASALGIAVMPYFVLALSLGVIACFAAVNSSVRRLPECA